MADKYPLLEVIMRSSPLISYFYPLSLQEGAAENRVVQTSTLSRTMQAIRAMASKPY